MLRSELGRRRGQHTRTRVEGELLAVASNLARKTVIRQVPDVLRPTWPRVGLDWQPNSGVTANARTPLGGNLQALNFRQKSVGRAAMFCEEQAAYGGILN